MNINKHLPLTIKLDYKIPPIPRAKSINIRPYMSSYEYKKEIEKLVVVHLYLLYSWFNKKIILEYFIWIIKS